MVDMPNETPIGQDKNVTLTFKSFALTSTVSKDLPFLFESRDRSL